MHPIEYITYPIGCKMSTPDRIRTCIFISVTVLYGRNAGRYRGMSFEFLALIPPLAACRAKDGFNGLSVVDGYRFAIEDAEIRFLRIQEREIIRWQLPSLRPRLSAHHAQHQPERSAPEHRA